MYTSCIIWFYIHICNIKWQWMSICVGLKFPLNLVVTNLVGYALDKRTFKFFLSHLKFVESWVNCIHQYYNTYVYFNTLLKTSRQYSKCLHTVHNIQIIHIAGNIIHRLGILNITLDNEPAGSLRIRRIKRMIF